MSILMRCSSKMKSKANVSVIDAVEKERNRPFSLWKANSKIPIGAIIRNEPDVPESLCNGQTIYNPFHDVQKITYEGYLFTLNRQKKILENETTRTYYFRCANPKRSCRCNLTVVVDPIKCSYDITPTTTESEFTHNDDCHQVNKNGDSITKAQIRLKTFAVELSRNNGNKLTKHEMISMVFDQMNQYNATHVEPMPYMKANKISHFLNVPHITKRELLAQVIPEEIFNKGGQWVLADIKSKSRMIILSSLKMSNISNSIQRLLIDGTFLTAPPGFKQVLNGIGYSLETRTFVPCFHILLQGNDAETYYEGLQQVLMRIEMNSLMSVNFDFEPSLIYAVRSIFMESSRKPIHLHGCLFHFVQALEKNFNSLYGKDAMREVLWAFRLCPFLNDDDYITFISYMNEKEEISDFICYFNAQWGDKGRVKREFWRYSSDDYEDEIITNGGAENYNGQINYSIGAHPSLGCFLTSLYDFNSDKFRKNDNDAVTIRCKSNTKTHYTPIEAKSEINKLFPSCFCFKQKPKFNRKLHPIESNSSNNEELLISKKNSSINIDHPLPFYQPKRIRKVLQPKNKGIRRRNSQNTKDKRVLDEMARIEANKRVFEEQVDNSSSTEEEYQLEEEIGKIEPSIQAESSKFSIDIRKRKSIVVYKDRDNSEEEDTE